MVIHSSTGHATSTRTREYLQRILVRHTIEYLYPWIQILVPTGGCTDTGSASDPTGTRRRVPAILYQNLPEARRASSDALLVHLSSLFTEHTPPLTELTHCVSVHGGDAHFRHCSLLGMMILTW